MEVRLWEDGTEVHLRVSDAGKGFDSHAAVQGQGLGLISMRERMRLLGGSIEIESHVGAGTTVHARVPQMEFGRSSLRATG